MGKVISHMKRPFLNYNIESRAHKIISQNKPIPAPHHKVEQLEIEQILKENSAEFQETLRKHEELNRNLKKVFVTSESKIESTGKPQRPLPTDRSSYSESTFVPVEPVYVPKGRVSLVNALKFITDHHADASKCKVDYIVKEYSLPEATVRNILRYCRTFEIYIPDDKKTKAKFAGPTIKRLKVTKGPSKQLTSGKGPSKQLTSGNKKEEDVKKIDK
ncbi:protein NDUFAF4 homolog [Coccinella septempunctata]|uniref:protein NDUFAF4 homolog n=1 Tax=Coccinella septempunctata TaxID=41139 RepID=UPI001D08B915|nr:protein NDUFAF4 homolog [Coccinella septempunctata]